MKAELASYDEEVSGSQLNVLLMLRPAMNSVLHGCFEVQVTSFKVSALILASPASDTCRDDWTLLT